MIMCFMIVGAMQVQGAIVHRYDFTDPNDKVGTADGILVNNTGNAKFENGQLILGNIVGVHNSNNNNGDYVDLPNGIISALGNQATIEVWTTWAGGGMWERIFDLGTSDGGENSSGGAPGSYYIFMTPRGGAERLRFGMNNPLPSRVEVVLDDEVLLPTNSEQHLVITWDGANNKVTMFRNGVQVDQDTTNNMTLAMIPDNNNWLGRAQWPDPMYVGRYNEFRIYNHAMSAGEVAASLIAGTEVSIASPVAPANGQKEVSRTPTLEWVSGAFPAGSTFETYRLFLSKDQDAVADGDIAALVGEMAATSYTVPTQLDTDSTYYWRVDERYKKAGAADPNVVVGGVVSFETVKTLPVLTASGSVFGILGSNLALNVNIVTASDIMSVAWYKVGETSDILLTEGTKYAMTYSNTQATLTINAVMEEDGGEYYAKVENSAGVQASTRISVMPRRGLAHRYSFDPNADPADPNVIDSISGANGILINNTGNARYEDGMLVLGNTGSQNSNATPPFTNGDYVDLPNGIISALGNLATIEAWVTWGGPAWNYWQRIFDFGTSNGGENNSGGAGNAYYWMASPWGGERMLRTGYRRGPNAEERVIDDVSGALTIGRQTHLAFVWDGAAGTIRMYVDGKQVGQNTLHFALSEMPDNNNWLGRAQWGDNLFVGRYNEFRIYDIPLTADMILAHYQAGPNVIGQDKPCPAYPDGDVNGDCKVDLNDLAEIAANWLICGGPMCQ